MWNDTKAQEALHLHAERYEGTANRTPMFRTARRYKLQVERPQCLERQSLHPPVIRHAGFELLVPPCHSTWRRWVVDTFTLFDTSGLDSPDVYEGGVAGFGSSDGWGMVVSWRGCVEDKGYP